MRSVLNFAPAVLAVPDGVVVRKVDLSTELQILAFHGQKVAVAGGCVVMSLVVLGLSHHGAPLSLLESVALDPEARTALETAVLRSEHVTEAVVLSTCNRTEVYAECLTFHGALADITDGPGRGLLGRPQRPPAAPVRALRGARHRPRLLGRRGPRLDGRR